MVKQFLANDGGMTDGLETHGKWPNDTPSSPHTLSNWQNDFPLKDYRYNRTWRYYANTQYRKAATEVGRTILVANNEYGFGEVTSFTGFTRYTKGLLLTEFLMEMFLGNWDMSCFWDICLQDRPEDGLLDAANNYRFNPFCFGMNMLADAQGGAFLTSLPAFAVESVDPTLHGFAARKDGVLLVYLLNKSNTSRPVTMQLQGASYPAAFARRMQNSTDGYGEMVNVTVQGSGTNFTCTLPSFTFTEFTFADPAAFLKIKSLAVSNGKAMLSWSSLPGAKFTIEQSANLIDWEPAQSNIAPDNLWTDSELDVGAARNRFFRLRLQP